MTSSGKGKTFEICKIVHKMVSYSHMIFNVITYIQGIEMLPVHSISMH